MNPTPEDQNDLRDAVARAESNGRLLPQQIENGCTWENSSPLWQSRMRQEADRLLASSGGKVLVARILTAETDLTKARSDLERVTAERDEAREERDALMRAAGFKPGPFRDALSRQVLLEDVAGRRPAMVEARRAAGRNQNDADLWTMRMLEQWPGDTLLTRLWRQRKDETKRADTAEAENTRLSALLVDAGEALRPLAAGANTADADAEAIFYPQARYPDDTTIDPILPSGEMPKLCELGDLRRARSTLAALDKAPTPKEPA